MMDKKRTNGYEKRKFNSVEQRDQAKEGEERNKGDDQLDKR